MTIQWYDIKKTMGLGKDAYLADLFHRFPVVTTDEHGYTLSSPGGKNSGHAHRICRYEPCTVTLEFGEHCRHMRVEQILTGYFAKKGSGAK
jgi:hypothetical protein